MSISVETIPRNIEPLLGAIGHQMRTYLSALHLQAELGLLESQEDSARRRLTQIQKESFGLKLFLEDLLDFGRLLNQTFVWDMQEFSIPELREELRMSLSQLVGESNLALSSFPEDGTLVGDLPLIRRAVTAYVARLQRALSSPRIAIVIETSPDSSFHIRASIQSEDQESLATGLFSLQEIHLDLAFAQRILARHNAHFETFSSDEDRGFVMKFPALAIPGVKRE